MNGMPIIQRRSKCLRWRRSLISLGQSALLKWMVLIVFSADICHFLNFLRNSQMLNAVVSAVFRSTISLFSRIMAWEVILGDEAELCTSFRMAFGCADSLQRNRVNWSGILRL